MKPLCQRCTLIPSLALCLTLAAVPAAQAKLPVFLEVRTPGPNDDTPVSGFTAANRILREPGSHAILYGLDFDEVGDKPCLIVAHWWRFTDDGKPQDFTTRFDICSSPADGDKSIVFANARETKTGVRGIQVCNNSSSNHRLKGAKILGATIDGVTGAVQSTGTSKSFERTNCSPPWKATRTCEAGQIAVGLFIEHSSEEITGLALDCSPVDIVATSPSVASVYGEMEADIQVETNGNGTTSTMTLLEAIDQHEVAGASVAVIENGAVALVRHYGYRNAVDHLPTNANTIYQTASISKLFAGLAMVRAAREGVGPVLTSTVQEWADAHPGSLIDTWVGQKFTGDAAGYPSEISVRRLLDHSAGLSHHGIGNFYDDTPTELATILLGDAVTEDTHPLSRPGTEHCYSGGAFSAAEAMLADAGLTPRVYLNGMLGDWGLTQSTYDEAADSMTDLARGCSRGTCSTAPPHTIAKFAGGLLSNPKEYATVLTLLLNSGLDALGNRVLPLADVRAVLTPTYERTSSLQACTGSCPAGETCIGARCMKPFLDTCDGGTSNGYGLGTFVTAAHLLADGYPRNLSHGGANPDGGSATFFFADRLDDDGIVIMVNGEYQWSQNGATLGANALVDDIKAAYFRHF